MVKVRCLLPSLNQLANRQAGPISSMGIVLCLSGHAGYLNGVLG
jgi:hypothetical protein